MPTVDNDEGRYSVGLGNYGCKYLIFKQSHFVRSIDLIQFDPIQQGNQLSDLLQSVNVNVISDKQCEDSYYAGSVNYPGNICASLPFGIAPNDELEFILFF